MLILASLSPRRAELLRRLGVEFRVCASHAPELDSGPDPLKLPQLNAQAKAAAVAELYPDCPVLGADTMIVLDSRPIGKPRDRAEAVDMLLMFSGRTHLVITGCALICASTGLCRTWSECSEVSFKKFDRAVAGNYVDAVEVLDKAGAYALQESHCRMLLAGFSGEPENIVGLPLKRLSSELSAIGELPSTGICPKL